MIFFPPAGDTATATNNESNTGRNASTSRPCFFPRTTTDAKGRQRRLYRYEDMMTPFDKLASLPGIESHLKPGITLAALRLHASALSDSQVARHLNAARSALFAHVFNSRKSA